MKTRTGRVAAAGLAAAALVGAGLLAASGGCSSSSGHNATATGDVALSFTDAPADDIATFDCEVLSVNLTRTDGLEVAALPTARRADFADLVGVSELFTLATVPVGTYTSLRITLNLVNNPPDPDGVVAFIQSSTIPATVLDTNGSAFTGPVELEVHLDPQTPLIVVPGSPRTLDIDFDLDGSTVVNVAQNQIKVLPILKADVEDSARPIRVRGGLVSTDAGAQSFMLGIRPHANSAPFGSIEVRTSSGTAFEVDGQTASGSAGFALLEAKPATTAVVAQGTYDFLNGVLTATAVRAGSSVPGGDLDVVEGIVVARAGAGNDLDLTVLGFTVERQTATVAYGQTVTVRTGAATRVTRRFHGAVLTASAIGVGQAVVCAGDLNAGVMGTPAAPVPVVHLVPTRICAMANGPIAGGTLSVDVARIGRLPYPAAFPGATTSPWTFATGTISAPFVALDTCVVISGIVETAIVESATALSITDATGFSLFVARFEPRPAQNPIATTPTEITIDFSGIPPAQVTKFTVTQCGTPQPVAGTMTVRKTGSPTGLFTIRTAGGTTTVHTVFDDWRRDLDARLIGGARPRRISAVGVLSGANLIESDSVAITVE